jgi:large subunit ribosomal protein L25
MTVKVPVHFSGEENSPAVKAEGCLVNHVMTELTISCFPADIPEFIAVDLSGMKKGSSLHVNDITLPKGVKFVVKGQENPVLASVSVIVEEAPAEAAPAADAKDGKDAKDAKAPTKAPAKAPAAKK